MFPVAEDSAARRLATGWLALAVAALGASGVFALLLVLSRTPGLGAVFPGHDFFFPALVLHVSLSVLIWFLSFAGVLWSAGLSPRALWLGWAGLWLCVAGAVLVVVSPLAGSGEALVNNYVPVLHNSVFLTGLALFGAGFGATLVRALWAGRRPAAGVAQVSHTGLMCGALAAVLAGISLAWSAAALPDFLPPAAYFEALFWGAGHGMQFMHTLLMLVVWLALASRAGAPRRGALVLLVLGVVPATLALWIHATYIPASQEFRHAFTLLMSWGTWIAAAPLGLMLAWRALKAGAPEDGPGRVALLLSILLFAFGLAVGAMIRHDNAMVPAHYHGVIGAVTLAYMAFALRLLPVLGLRPPAARVARWQAWAYGGGTLLMAAGLAWSGGHGVSRKTAGAQQLLDGAAETAGMAVMGVGGLVAVAGSLLFVILVFRAMVGRRELGASGPSAAPMDRRPLALGLTLGLILMTGTLVTLLPGAGLGPGVRVQAPPTDPRRDPGGHAAEKRRAEIKARFEQAVVMLHAKQYEYAAAALHRVLELDPAIPEAHVNMGFAMIGLQRFDVARDFFEGAIALRPMQANAYYGLAEALEGTGDLAGAMGAMRTYVHLSSADDPFLPRARAAIWEWETQRDVAKGATPPPAQSRK